MLTLTQKWNGYDRILIIDEENNSSVQLTIYKDEKMTAFLHSLYVPKDKRKKGPVSFVDIFRLIETCCLLPYPRFWNRLQ